MYMYVYLVFLTFRLVPEFFSGSVLGRSSVHGIDWALRGAFFAPGVGLGGLSWDEKI